MDILLGMAIVGVWIVVSVVGLRRAYNSRRRYPAP